MTPSLVAAAALIAATGLAACRTSEVDQASARERGADRPSGAAGIVVRGSMADSMATHLRVMDRASGDDIQTMLPAHRQMAAKALHHMTSEVWTLSTRLDGTWNATVDSLRHDLERMTALDPRELEAMMPAHGARWMRLVSAYREAIARTPR